MIHTLIGRRIALPETLLSRYPDLARASYRRGGLPPRVAGWCLGQSTVAAITLWHTVWLADSTRSDTELLLHELRHVAQFESSRVFPIRYVWETLRRGYHANRYEVEARRYAAMKMRDTPDSNPDTE